MKRFWSLCLALCMVCAAIPMAALGESQNYTYTMVMENFGPPSEDPVMVKY